MKVTLVDGTKDEFVWGNVVKNHAVGEYNIIEFVRDGEHLFHAYIGGKDTNHSFTSLDAALVGVIAYKYEGGNHRADRYFTKMVGMENGPYVEAY
jgi:hypothetical protein